MIHLMKDHDCQETSCYQKIFTLEEKPCNCKGRSVLLRLLEVLDRSIWAFFAKVAGRNHILRPKEAAPPQQLSLLPHPKQLSHNRLEPLPRGALVKVHGLCAPVAHASLLNPLHKHELAAVLTDTAEALPEVVPAVEERETHVAEHAASCVDPVRYSIREGGGFFFLARARCE